MSYVDDQLQKALKKAKSKVSRLKEITAFWELVKEGKRTLYKIEELRHRKPLDDKQFTATICTQQDIAYFSSEANACLFLQEVPASTCTYQIVEVPQEQAKAQMLLHINPESWDDLESEFD